MNRFLIECFQSDIAKSLCDKHIVKMPLEEAQMLSHALHRHMGNEDETFAEFNERMGTQNGPKAHAKHPCTVWAGETRANYEWALTLLKQMCREKTRRYGKPHKCESLIPLFEKLKVNIPDGNITPHPQCFGSVDEECRTQEDWPIGAYRKYYKWKYDTTDWCKENKLNPTPDWLINNVYKGEVA